MIYNRIEVVNVDFQQLASDDAKRSDFVDALNEYGKNDWEIVQVQQVGPAMLVFMKKKG